MLAKKQRLTREEFSDYYTKGRRQGGLVSNCILVPGLTYQAAVVVGKKVSKKAVMRNRLKRLGYRQIKSWQENTGYIGVIIMILKPTITSLSRKEQALTIQKDLGLLLK
jgi:ribonuclease P protein component